MAVTPMPAHARATETIAPEIALTDSERDTLFDALLSVDANPYRHYQGFSAQIALLAGSGTVPGTLRDYADLRRASSPADHPVGYLANAPIDRDVPIFDYEEPVLSKYALKSTFVAEAFLVLWAELVGTPGIGYLNVNNGDVFQDIYPKRSLAHTQSQKALREICFHKDLANHFVRPDYVYMLGMRSDPANLVLTTFAGNRDIVAALSDAQIALARQPRFMTPWDDLTILTGAVKVGEANSHPLLSGDFNLRLFEGRTVGLDDAAQAVVDSIVTTIHAIKRGINVGPGDFVITCNNHCVHAKELVDITNEDALRTRWILKTVNVDALAPHSASMVAGVPYLVRG
jgi:L-asparagine oxygenase